MNEPSESATAGADPRPAVVERTGIALVHLGEQIIAGEKGAARLRADDESTVVRYVFPVEVEIVGEAAADAVFDSLRRAFEALG